MEVIEKLKKKVMDEVGLSEEEAQKTVESFFESVAIVSMNNEWNDVELVMDPEDEDAIRLMKDDIEDEES